MKKIIFTSFIVVFILALVGCSSNDNGNVSDKDNNTKEAGTEEVTLKAIMEQVPDADIIEDMLDDFYEDNPNVKLDIEMLPFDQMREKIISSSLAPEPVYDLIIVDNPWMYDFASEGHLENLNDYVDQSNENDEYNYDDFATPLRDIAELDGDIYAIPFYNYALGLIYRGDIFEEMDLTPPTTIDELQSTAKELTTDDMYGIAMQPERGYKIFEEWANWLFAEGGEIVDDDGKIQLDSAAAKSSLEKYIETFEASAPEGSINWGFDEAQRSVSTGDAAMMLSYNWMLPTLNNPELTDDELAGNYELAEIPGENGGVLGAWFWAIPSNANYKDEAWDFISWVTSPEVDLERVLEGGAPTRLSVIDEASKSEDGYGESYYNVVSKLLENSQPIADGPNAEEMIQEVGTQLSEAISGGKSVDDALKDAAEKAKEIAGE